MLQRPLFAALLLLCCSSSAGTSSAAAKAPNIVIITSDDGGNNGFGFSAAVHHVPTQFETPNLDALAADGIVLKQGYVASPICTPSRIGLLTGQYGNRFGMEDVLGEFKPNHPTWGLAPEQTTIAEHLQKLGYVTGAIGKWHVGHLEGYNRPLDRGFDEFFGIIGGQRAYWHEPLHSLYRGMFRGNEYHESQYRAEGDRSKYDPELGRYVTDAWGEEAVDFINRHADIEQPFFLYLNYTTPHTPVVASQAKPVDLAHFSHVAVPHLRNLAAMTYAMDRSIGEVLSALKSCGVYDNTIVVFMNDNGPPKGDGTVAPFTGNKGTTFEGGIRVPFLIKMPGVVPGIYDAPVTALDMLPTLVAAAGGDVSKIPTDGRDVRPLLAGEAKPDPKQVFFWRNSDAWAVRRGDWKLSTRVTRPDPSLPPNPPFLINLASDAAEEVLRNTEHRGIEAVLLSELTHWEAKLQKPKWGSLSVDTQNQFDHFVFRSDASPAANWSDAQMWSQPGTDRFVTMNRADGYANAVLEFRASDDVDYAATNDMQRLSRQTFMLNQFRFAGNFTAPSNRKAKIDGLPVLMVKSLSGDSPQIVLNTTASDTSARFRFELENELQLLDDLEISGAGTQDFVLSGAIRDFYVATAPPDSAALISVPHDVRKTGTSTVVLAGKNTFGGKLVIDGGQVELRDASAGIKRAAGIVVARAGTFVMQDGNVSVQTVDCSPGGKFEFTGGTLEAAKVLGNLANKGGRFSPGRSPAGASISGDYIQRSGTLRVGLNGPKIGIEYDTLYVNGKAQLAGRLEVKLYHGYLPTAGSVFEILTARGGIEGEFSDQSLPSLPAGLSWKVISRTKSICLVVAPTSSRNTRPGRFTWDNCADLAEHSFY